MLSHHQLYQRLHSLDGQSYKAYKSLRALTISSSSPCI
jgi:hypothetical protein